MKWPKHGGTVRFSKICEPIRDVVDHLYELKRKSECDVLWKGLPLADELSSSCEQPANLLTADSLRYDEHDQGRDPMRVLIGIAVMLGIEQGVRMERMKRETQNSTRDSMSDLIKLQIELKNEDI